MLAAEVYAANDKSLTDELMQTREKSVERGVWSVECGAWSVECGALLGLALTRNKRNIQVKNGKKSYQKRHQWHH